MDSGTELVVRRMVSADADEVASLHLQAFEGYFMSHLGLEFLRRYYRQFTMDQEAYSVLALVEGRVVGFVVGFDVGSSFERRFFREHFVWLAWTVATKAVTNSAVRTGLLQRMLFFRRAFASLFGRGQGAKQQTRPLPPDVPDGAGASLLGIAVHPSFRGQGVAERLQDAFLKLLKDRDVSWVRLSVKPDNKRAIAFYEKVGWVRTRSTTVKVSFLRRL